MWTLPVAVRHLAIATILTEKRCKNLGLIVKLFECVTQSAVVVIFVVISANGFTQNELVSRAERIGLGKMYVFFMLLVGIIRKLREMQILPAEKD